jgi:hypothetical protein
MRARLVRKFNKRGHHRLHVKCAICMFLQLLYVISHRYGFSSRFLLTVQVLEVVKFNRYWIENASEPICSILLSE